MVVTAITGTAGVGKTALALHWSHQVRDSFPDGELYVNLRGFDPSGQVMDPGTAIGNFLEALGVGPEGIPADPDAQAALYRSKMSGRRMLLVLDNARDSSQVRPLLPAAAGCLVVVTSRNQLTGLATDGAHLLNLDLLSTTEAREFLAHRLGAERVAAEPQAVDNIIARCARLPLALAVVAARAAAKTQLGPAALAAQLDDARERLDVLVGDDPATDVRAVFSWSYRALSPAAARLFRLLGVHPGPDIGVPAAASLAGVPVAQVRRLLDELTRASLLVEHAPGRYDFHDLLRAYATELAGAVDSDADLRDSRRRMFDYYLFAACVADGQQPQQHDRTVEPVPVTPGIVPEAFGDAEAATAWLAGELPVLLAAVDLASATGFDAHACRFAWHLSVFLQRRGRWRDWAAVQLTAVQSAQRLADPAVKARAHRVLGSAYIRLARYDEAEAELQRALALYRETDDRFGQARTHHIRGMIFDRQGQRPQQIEECRRAHALYQAAGDRVGEASTLSDIGWGYSLLGDHQQALVTCRQALVLLQEIGDRSGEAAAWDSLGHAHHHLGDYRQAIECYERSLVLQRELGEMYDEAGVLDHLGDSHHATGDHDAARHHWQAALAILVELGHRDADRLRAKL